MTPKQRQAIRDRQNARNMKPGQRQAKRDHDEACRALRRNTLHKNSIAMVNPFITQWKTRHEVSLLLCTFAIVNIICFISFVHAMNFVIFSMIIIAPPG
ncbi:hypothetical protein U9M48_037297 [Paspalum notatum var. saurae]|uniref:Uncharacterized protein n=1 Tax=Paspalum notatum var. saurae TaxID=547442 RepID=A0AAQ3UEP0_PASNO